MICEDIEICQGMLNYILRIVNRHNNNTQDTCPSVSLFSTQQDPLSNVSRSLDLFINQSNKLHVDQLTHVQHI